MASARCSCSPVDAAQRVLDRINRVHRTVVGTSADGRPYAATDSPLLRFVGWALANPEDPRNAPTSSAVVDRTVSRRSR